jgi:hypothetical protein
MPVTDECVRSSPWEMRAGGKFILCPPAAGRGSSRRADEGAETKANSASQRDAEKMAGTALGPVSGLCGLRAILIFRR